MSAMPLSLSVTSTPFVRILLDLIVVFVNLDLLEMEKSALVRYMHLIWSKSLLSLDLF